MNIRPIIEYGNFESIDRIVGPTIVPKMSIEKLPITRRKVFMKSIWRRLTRQTWPYQSYGAGSLDCYGIDRDEPVQVWEEGRNISNLTPYQPSKQTTKCSVYKSLPCSYHVSSFDGSEGICTYGSYCCYQYTGKLFV